MERGKVVNLAMAVSFPKSLQRLKM